MLNDISLTISDRLRFSTNVNRVFLIAESVFASQKELLCMSFTTDTDGKHS